MFYTILAVILSFNVGATSFVYPCQGQSGSFRMNPDNSQGGFVADTAMVDATVFISADATVCGSATVIEGAFISDRAIISGRSTVRGNVQVAGKASVYGDAYVTNQNGERMLINDNSKIYGQAYINGSVVISGESEVYGWGKVLKFAQISGITKICGSATVRGYDILVDDQTRCPQ